MKIDLSMRVDVVVVIVMKVKVMSCPELTLRVRRDGDGSRCNVGLG